MTSAIKTYTHRKRNDDAMRAMPSILRRFIMIKAGYDNSIAVATGPNSVVLDCEDGPCELVVAIRVNMLGPNALHHTLSEPAGFVDMRVHTCASTRELSGLAEARA